jgi:hypothetical protein
MSIHEKLKDFKKWVDIDIQNEKLHSEITENIDDDLDKLSPEILDDLSKYEKYLEHMSVLGQSQMSVLRMDKMLTKSFLTAFAVIKFKNLLKHRKNKL